MVFSCPQKSPLGFFQISKSPRHLSYDNNALFSLLGTSMVALFILASACEVYSSLFSCCCFCLGGDKFLITFAGKMFKPTISSIHQW